MASHYVNNGRCHYIFSLFRTCTASSEPIRHATGVSGSSFRFIPFWIVFIPFRCKFVYSNMRRGIVWSTICVTAFVFLRVLGYLFKRSDETWRTPLRVSAASSRAPVASTPSDLDCEIFTKPVLVRFAAKLRKICFRTVLYFLLL